GIEIGMSNSISKSLRLLKTRALLLPFTSALGTLVGAAIAAKLLGMNVFGGLSIGAGFGWYSLSSIMLSKLAGAELAALAFLTNVFRELLAIPIIPLLAKFNLGVAIIVPGGATTMDTTLPLISRVSNEETTLLAFYHGAALSLMVPFLVALFAAKL
ncbi:MAG: lysine exporter LysO family protein, partial [bacterium]|nr:lysine exporter LysO family protein [bacterium]